MNVTAEELRAHYESLDTDQLVKMYSAGGLTELASSVLTDVLGTRGLSNEALDARIAEHERKDSQDRQDAVTVRMPRIWVGYGFAAAVFLYAIGEAIVDETAEDRASPVLFTISLGGWLYWLFCVQRMHEVVEEATNGKHPVTPLKAVAFHFLPIFNIYWIFKWPNQLATFVNNRTNVDEMAKGWPGFFLLLSALIGRFDSSIGLVAVFTVGLYLAKKIRAVVQFAAVSTARVTRH